jgi:ectoine hydroxylase-related dioxygenase (phytanoyl-CoA dioxygenase family)
MFKRSSPSPVNPGFLSDEQIDYFEQNGYVIVDFGFDHDELDALINTLQPLYDPEHLRAPAFGARIQDAWQFVKPVHTLATHPNVLSALHQLFGRQPRPFQTLNFPFGTQQKIHSDTIHFSSMPAGFMAGVWVALEDIDENNGPLRYYPGSHKLPQVSMQDAGLAPGYEHYPAYETFMENKVSSLGIRQSFGLMPKGHALIWHANLLHGGAEHKDHQRSRHSQVTHYFFEGCRYYTPLHSTPEKIHYRKPVWIRPDKWVQQFPVTPQMLAQMPYLARHTLRLKRWLQRNLP